MKAMMKSGKVISGRLAETFVKIGLAKEKGNLKNLKPRKKKSESESEN